MKSTFYTNVHCDKFSGTGVDALTQTMLNQHFEWERISDNNETRWLWLWKRRLAAIYPLYQNQLDAWKAYRTEDWFYDKIKVNDKRHEEYTQLTESMKRELSRNLNEAINRKIDETNTKTSETGTTDAYNQTDKNSASQSGKFNESEKTRAFNFAFPESNYTGGVIPYNLDNNPSVEFITNQSDGLRSDNQESSSQSQSDYESHSGRKGTTSISEDVTSDKDEDETRDETSSEDETNTKDQMVKNGYTDHYDYDGSNIIELASKIFDLLPTTDFFKQLCDGLRDLFNHVWYEEGFCNDDEFI